MGDAWIGQPAHPCTESENINELLSRVTRGFDSPHSPLGSQKLLSQVTSGFDSPHSPLRSQKLLSRVTRGFYSQDSPLGSEKSPTNSCPG
jgi:hypothetical protein